MKFLESVPFSITSIGDKEIAKAVAIHFRSEFSSVRESLAFAVSSCPVGLGLTSTGAGLGRQLEAEAFSPGPSIIRRATGIGKPLQLNELAQLARWRDQNAANLSSRPGHTTFPSLASTHPAHPLVPSGTRGLGQITGTCVGFRSQITLSR